MSDSNELEEILNELKQRNEKGAQDDFEAPAHREYDINDIEFEKFSIHCSSKSDPPGKKDSGQKSSPSDGGKKKGLIIGIIVAVLIIAVAVAAVLALNVGSEEETTQPSTTTEPQTTQAVSLNVNPLTGESGYHEDAVGKRPVAVVVENEYSTAAVRPQWGITEADIVLEGESEYSTRLLFFYADYTNMPAQIGPVRSARPPFIKFSELFDSIFIHYGQSKTKGNYIGANTVFNEDNVDHCNGTGYSSDGYYFGRDNSRNTLTEHTAYFNGSNAQQLIEVKKQFRTEIDEDSFTSFSFNDEDTDLSTVQADSVEFVWSSRCPKTGTFTYDSATGLYKTTDFDSSYGESGYAVKNVILMLDTTQYIIKENYKNSGSSETYCDYKLSGGEGKILSNGTVVDMTWEVEDNKLVFKDSDGNEVKLNPGKSYIGYGSSNNGGSITIQ